MKYIPSQLKITRFRNYCELQIKTEMIINLRLCGVP